MLDTIKQQENKERKCIQRNVNKHKRSHSTKTQILFGFASMLVVGMLLASTQLPSHDDSIALTIQTSDNEKSLLSPPSLSTKSSLTQQLYSVVADSVSASENMAHSESLRSQLQRSELQSKVDKLHRQEKDLQEKVTVLTNETLELNNELLRKELMIIELKDRIASTTQSRIVYNFVDVPIGSDVNAFKQSHLKPSPNQKADAADLDYVLNKDSDLTALPDDQGYLLAEELSEEYIDGLFNQLTQLYGDH